MSDNYYEMMAHVPLFSHRKPAHVAILADPKQRILQEALQHRSIARLWSIMPQKEKENSDERIQYCYEQIPSCLAGFSNNALDVLISGSFDAIHDYALCFNKLKSEGLFMQACPLSLALEGFKNIQQIFRKVGFSDVLLLHFPPFDSMPHLEGAILAVKQGTLKRPREKDIFNKAFATQYYNLDMHKAAFALPEFIRMGEA